MYMVAIRYMVFVPFFMVNISAAVLGVSFQTFFVTTFFATIPGCLMQTTAGRGLTHFIDEYGGESMFTIFYRTIMNDDMTVTVVILILNSAAWGLVVVWLKYFRKSKTDHAE